MKGVDIMWSSWYSNDMNSTDLPTFLGALVCYAAFMAAIAYSVIDAVRGDK